MVTEVADKHGKLQNNGCEDLHQSCFSLLQIHVELKIRNPPPATLGYDYLRTYPALFDLRKRMRLAERESFPRIRLACRSWGPHQVPGLSNWSTLPGTPVLARAIRQVPQGESRSHPSLLSRRSASLDAACCLGGNCTQSAMTGRAASKGIAAYLMLFRD